MSEVQRKACIAGAKAGGRVLLRHFRHLSPGQVEEKTRNDLVSDADREAERAIQAELAHRFPSYGFLGEEGGAHGETQVRWVVDPLDGTLNFVQGLPHWCVSVALWDAQGPAVACIWDPLKNDLFEAARGKGARWNGHPMAVSRQRGLEGAFLATGFAFQLGERFPVWQRALDRIWPRAKGIRRAGSAALDLAYTACGLYDGYFELGLKKWDMAAGILLVHEAGGHVSDWQGGGAWWESGDIVAGTPTVQQDLVRTLRAAGVAG
jgi:myo-inositol-1(or 4)-monophosphatase